MQFAIADFEGLAVPTVELFGNPDGMLLGAENVERVRRRINSLAVGIIVFGEKAELNWLRFDAERFGGERSRQIERGLIAAAGAEHGFARGGFFDHLRRQAFPGHADIFDAEIVVSFDFEGKLFGVEDDFHARQIFAGQCGRLRLRGRRPKV